MRSAMRREEEPGPLLEDRIANVTSSLERLEVGVAESGVITALSSHFDKLEADRTLARLEMRRMQVCVLYLMYIIIH